MFFKLANMFMRGAAFLGADSSNSNTGTDKDIVSGAKYISGEVVETITSVLVPILAIVGAAGIIWAIVLGINMARADSAEKREETKKRLISLIVGIVIMIALVFFFQFGFMEVLKAFGAIKPEAVA